MKKNNKTARPSNKRQNWQTHAISKRQVAKIVFNHLQQRGFVVDRKRGSYMDEQGVCVDISK